jgi:hypothetical protein
MHKPLQNGVYLCIFPTNLLVEFTFSINDFAKNKGMLF